MISVIHERSEASARRISLFVWLYLVGSVSGFLIADIAIIALLYRAVVPLERIAC
jgi:hypothetical protein